MYLPAIVLFRINRSPQDGTWLYVVVAVMIVIGTFTRWKFISQWLKGVRGKNWTKVSATVQSVDVSAEPRRRGDAYQGRSYLGTITYLYRNPELQSGEFTRLFDTEDEAEAWANSYKDSKVTVRVNPRDPAESVVREEDV